MTCPSSLTERSLHPSELPCQTAASPLPPPLRPLLPHQTAEYLLEKGLLDLVVPRSYMKGALFEIIDFYKVSGPRGRGGGWLEAWE
jgi:hypothetical protein